MEFALPAIFRTVQRLQPEDTQEHQLTQQILRITEVLIYNSHKFAVFRVHSMLNTELQRMWEKLLNVHHIERRLNLTILWLHLWQTVATKLYDILPREYCTQEGVCNKLAQLLHILRTWAGAGARAIGQSGEIPPAFRTELLKEVCNLLECLGPNLNAGLKHVVQPLMALLDIQYVPVADKKLVLKAIRRSLFNLNIREYSDLICMRVIGLLADPHLTLPALKSLSYMALALQV